MAGAAAAAARAGEIDAMLQKAETRIGIRLDEAKQHQVPRLDTCGRMLVTFGDAPGERCSAHLLRDMTVR